MNTKPNLSFHKLATTLGALAVTSALAACANQTPSAKDPVTSSETTAPAKPAAGGHASCSAAGCGADKKQDPAKTGQASCSASAAASKPAAEAATSSAPATEASAAPEETKEAAATTPAKKPAAKKPTSPAKKSGHASCGAGTCSASPAK